MRLPTPMRVTRSSRTEAPDGAVALRTWLRGRLDWFIPDSLRREGDDIVSLARTVAAVGLSAIFWGGALVWHDARKGEVLPLVLAAILTLALVSAPFVMRATGRFAPVRVLLMTAAYVAVGGSALAYGGWRSPVFIVLAVLPGFAVAMRGIRLAFVLQLASNLIATLVFAADHAGWVDFGQPRPGSHYFLALLVWYVISWLWFVAIMAFGRANRLSLAELRRSNVELEAARDEAREANRAKSAFLANISHEMRTPLNGVIGLGQLLARTRLDEHQRKLADQLSQSAVALCDVINQVLDYSKIVTTRIELEHRRFELEEPLEHVLRCVALKAEQKAVELTAFVDPRLPRFVLGDPLRVRQVLMNLLDNAIKFTEQGTVSVRMRLGGESAGGVRVEVEVEDTGIGFDPQSAERLFSPFTQADDSTTRRFGGTGLGLSIARELAERMGGCIELASTPGRGSMFRFQASFELDGQRDDPEARGSRRSTAPLRAWILEPHPIRRKALEDCLRALDVPFFAVDCGIDPIHPVEAAEAPPDVVIAAAEIGFDRVQTVCSRSEATPRIAYVVGVGATIAPLGWPETSARLERPVTPRRLLACLWPAPSLEPDTSSVDAPFCGRILVAEDNPVNQLVAQHMLEGFGCDVLVVRDGQEAVEASAKTRFDLILLDLHMPKLGGIEAAHRIREACSEAGGAPPPPIVAVTADLTEEARVRVSGVGMSDFIPKPFSQTELRRVLERFLS